MTLVLGIIALPLRAGRLAPLRQQGVGHPHHRADPTPYREEPVSDTPVLQEGSEVWNGRTMHTVDPHRMPDSRWIALVDELQCHPVANTAKKATR